MKLIITLILLISGCTNPVPKYRYLDCVQITDGFYKGSMGYITDWYYTKDLYIVKSYQSSSVYDKILPDYLDLIIDCNFLSHSSKEK